MKKKSLALLVSLSLILGLTACGNAKKQTETGSAAGSGGTENVTEENQEESTLAEAAENKETGKWDFSGITLNIAHSTTGEVGDALRRSLMHLKNRQDAI